MLATSGVFLNKISYYTRKHSCEAVALSVDTVNNMGTFHSIALRYYKKIV